MATKYTIFIDDSKAPDPPANCLAALVVPNDRLVVVEERWMSFRSWLLEEYGLPIDVELNGSNLIRGRYKKHGIYRKQGSAAFKYALKAIATVQGLGVMASIFRGHMNFQKRTFQFLGERLEANMFYRDGVAEVICDHGDSMVSLFQRLKAENEIKAREFRSGGKFVDGMPTKPSA